MSHDYAVTDGHALLSLHRYLEDVRHIERFLSHRLKLKPDQACAVYDFSKSD